MAAVCVALLLLPALLKPSIALTPLHTASKVDNTKHDVSISPESINLTPYVKPTEGGERRYSLHLRALPWLEAMQACWRRGEQLAVPRSRADAVQLGRLLLASAFNVTHTTMVDAIHVGVHDIAKEDKWRTLDGQLLSEIGYDLWMVGGNGWCAALVADGRYIRQPCGTALAYACEPATPPAQKTAGNYTRVPGVGLFRLYEEPLPWALALQRCESEGATLAVPASAREAGLLAGVLITRASEQERLRKHGFFVGITDVAHEGEWRTTSGQTLSEAGYDVWGANEPSGGREKNCGALLEDGRYADYPCLVPMSYCCKLRNSDNEQPIFSIDRYRFFLQKLRWMEALQACHLLNATLAVSKSVDEEAAMKRLINVAKTNPFDTDHFVHVGIHDIEETGNWRTLAGDAAWSSRQNGNRSYTRTRIKYSSRNGYCGKMDYDGRYGAARCDKKYPYICEITS